MIQSYADSECELLCYYYIGVATNSVHISPSPTISVYDGLADEDVDFQHDISSISGKVSVQKHD